MHRAARAVARFWRKAYEDGLTGLASMVAYNLLLSIFPLALIALFVAGRVLRSPELAASVLKDAETIFPSAAETTLSEAINRLEQSSTTVGIVAVISSLWVSASFWGALDTAFHSYFEDTDYCLRAGDLGIAIAVAGAVTLRHDQHGSTTEHSEFRTRLFEASRATFASRWQRRLAERYRGTLLWHGTTRASPGGTGSPC